MTNKEELKELQERTMIQTSSLLVVRCGRFFPVSLFLCILSSRSLSLSSRLFFSALPSCSSDTCFFVFCRQVEYREITSLQSKGAVRSPYCQQLHVCICKIVRTEYSSIRYARAGVCTVCWVVLGCERGCTYAYWVFFMLCCRPLFWP